MRTEITAREAAAAVLSLLTLSITPARAQDAGVSLPLAPRESRQTNALEIAVAAGSAQAYGKTD
ncbi:MAG TPA: hypothetical protein VLW85_23970, partial [Myxococcales bacterium]|nr:hypothetical protein [Myxococcales bacterium]